MKLEPHFSKRLDLGIKLAKSSAQIEVAQRLRYCVFYEEMGALPDVTIQTSKRDQDSFDEICDHLLVTRSRTENSNPELCIDDDEVVGTYRMLRQTIAKKHGGFHIKFILAVKATMFFGDSLSQHAVCANHLIIINAEFGI